MPAAGREILFRRRSLYPPHLITVYYIARASPVSIGSLSEGFWDILKIFGDINMKFAFYTLGCKVNQYETQAMEQKLLAMGHTLGSFDEPCDCYVINTCTVTAVADKKNRGIIRKIPRPL